MIPDVRWARSPHDGTWHAIGADTALQAPRKGYAETRCDLTLPGNARVIALPLAPLCMDCVMTVAAELPEPPDEGGWGGPP